jgi:hypothetical protein
MDIGRKADSIPSTSTPPLGPFPRLVVCSRVVGSGHVVLEGFDKPLIGPDCICGGRRSADCDGSANTQLWTYVENASTTDAMMSARQYKRHANTQRTEPHIEDGAGAICVKHAIGRCHTLEHISHISKDLGREVKGDKYTATTSISMRHVGIVAGGLQYSSWSQGI